MYSSRTFTSLLVMLRISLMSAILLCDLELPKTPTIVCFSWRRILETAMMPLVFLACVSRSRYTLGATKGSLTKRLQVKHHFSMAYYKNMHLIRLRVFIMTSWSLVLVLIAISLYRMFIAMLKKTVDSKQVTEIFLWNEFRDKAPDFRRNVGHSSSRRESNLSNELWPVRLL